VGFGRGPGGDRAHPNRMKQVIIRDGGPVARCAASTDLISQMRYAI
jgi:hypothetical protein